MEKRRKGEKGMNEGGDPSFFRHGHNFQYLIFSHLVIDILNFPIPVLVHVFHSSLIVSASHDKKENNNKEEK